MLIKIDNEKSMQLLAEKLAAHIPNNIVFGLEGSLGAGKTTFSRYFIHARGFSGHVKSPTYTLVNSYPCQGGDIHHFDCYRLSGKNAWFELGVDEYFNDESLCLIEWPSIIDNSAIDILMTIHINGDARECTLQALTEKGRSVLSKI